MCRLPDHRKHFFVVSVNPFLLVNSLKVGPFSENIACGINGGLPQAVFEYIKNMGGVEAEEDYQYCVGAGRCKPCAPQGYDPDICQRYPISKCKEEDSCNAKLDPSKFVQGLKVSRWHKVAPNEKIIAEALEDEGPLVAAIDAIDLQFYVRGILQPDRCRPYRLNHAVLLSGYGAEGGVEYWKVLNSWGAKFGENGFFRLARGVGACGVQRYVMTVDLE
ncbi:hypothetical protein Btru_076139 [Bulinus truncatus]|nr:hypothetical protein Btru_076139 [Bulinus truncatus]